MLDDTLICIENLNSGYLTHRILDPQVLSKYLETIEDDWKTQHWNMSQSSQVYTNTVVIL